MPKYEGVCIGGPDDGTAMSHYETILKRLPADFGQRFHSSAEPDMERDDVAVYYFTSMALLGRDPFDSSVEVVYGFWLLKGLTIEDAMAALQRRYQEPRRVRELLKDVSRYLRTYGRAAAMDGPSSNIEYVSLTHRITEELTNED